MKLANVLIAGIVGAAASIVAIANRDPVLFSLDPFSKTHPALAFEAPLYLLVFVAFVAGVLLGGFVVMLGRWSRQRAKDRAARQAAREPAP
jgi:uncharacterized integral membrane protein